MHINIAVLLIFCQDTATYFNDLDIEWVYVYIVIMGTLCSILIFIFAVLWPLFVLHDTQPAFKNIFVALAGHKNVLCFSVCFYGSVIK